MHFDAEDRRRPPSDSFPRNSASGERGSSAPQGSRGRSSGPNAPSLRDFYRALFGSVPEGHFVHVCTYQSQVAAVPVERSGAIAGRVRGKRDHFFTAGVLAGEVGSGRNGRITNADIAYLPFLWSEIDRAGEPGHKTEGKLWTPEDFDRLIDWLPIKPSAITDSGGGWWLFWILDEPLEVGADGVAEELLSRWRAWWLGIGKQFDRHIDSGIWNLGRIIRAPGSINAKEGMERPAVVVSLDA